MRCARLSLVLGVSSVCCWESSARDHFLSVLSVYVFRVSFFFCHNHWSWDYTMPPACDRVCVSVCVPLCVRVC